MIAFIKGTLDYAGPDAVVVETENGVGYLLQVSASTVSALPPLGSPVKLHTFLSVREDGVFLYGFANREELEMFRRLLGVSGIGPKGALGFLSVLSPGELMMAVLSDDVKTLSRAPGIGKKTAQRMILDLKDKFQGADIAFGGELQQAAVTFVQGDPKSEAVEALAQLGYTRSEAVRAVSGVEAEGLSTEAILKQALKRMVK